MPLKKLKEKETVAQRSWVRLLVVALNFLYGGKVRTVHGPASEAQAICLARLCQAAEVWVEEMRGRVHLPDWEELLKKRRIDYCGDEVSSPEPLTWRQIEPGLPRAGLAGSLNPEDFAEGLVLELLRDPRKVLRAPGAWEEAPRRAKVWVESEAEWDVVCDGLVALGLLEECDETLVDASGRLVENGSFGVEKAGEELLQPEGLPILRLIINLIPANARGG